MTHKLADYLNAVAEYDFELAKGMLNELNMIYGNKYGWLAKKVVEFENPKASTCVRYSNCKRV